MKRSWFLGTLVFLMGISAAYSEERGIGFETIDWAIHPSMKGKERAILRAALEVVFEECPALKEIDWGAVMTKEDQYQKADFSASKLYATIHNPTGEDILAAPYIEGWEHHGSLSLYLKQKDGTKIDWSLNFSWEEPAGIATGMATHVEPLHGWRRKSCDYDELRITNFADFDERIYWFKRVDRLADVVREVEATYKD